MKRFIIKTIFFFIPLSIFLFEGFLPLNTFTYRPWEALIYKTKKGIAFPFYPNQKIDMNSVGDLCHHTNNEITKYENWITDNLGYRNDSFVRKADVLFIGDSFIAGSSLPQDSTITNQTQKKIKGKAYNIAPSNFNEFISLIEGGIIEKPNLVVYGIVERSIPAKLYPTNKEYVTSNVDRFLIFKDKTTRLYSVKYLISRMLSYKGNGKKGTESKMFFLNGKNQQYHYDKINDISKTIINYKSYCDSIGANFVFLALPNKETVYFENVPLDKQPNFLFKLDSVLNQNGITTVNTLKIFNDAKNNTLLYNLDDTHWNSNGVAIVVNELIEKARTHNILYK